jgi:hypothetical protein
MPPLLRLEIQFRPALPFPFHSTQQAASARGVCLPPARQVAENIAASDLPPLSADKMKKIRALYDRQIRPLMHHYW